MMFRMELAFTLKDMRQFQAVHQRYRNRVLFVVLRVTLVLAALALLVSSGLLIYFRVFDAELLKYYLILLLIIPLYYALMQLNFRTMLKSARSHGTIILSFDDAGCHEKSEAITAEYAYPSFCDLVHYKDTYYLYIDKLKAQILPERCFTEGDPAAFGAFIEQKTGLKIKEIK